MNWMTSAKKRVYKSRKQKENEYRVNAKFKLPPISFASSTQRMSLLNDKTKESSRKDHDLLMLSNLEREKKYCHARTGGKPLAEFKSNQQKQNEDNPLSRLELSPPPTAPQYQPTSGHTEHDPLISLSQTVCSELLLKDQQMRLTSVPNNNNTKPSRSCLPLDVNIHHASDIMHESHFVDEDQSEEDAAFLADSISPILFINDGKVCEEQCRSLAAAAVPPPPRPPHDPPAASSVDYERLVEVEEYHEHAFQQHVLERGGMDACSVAQAWDLFEGQLPRPSSLVPCQIKIELEDDDLDLSIFR